MTLAELRTALQARGFNHLSTAEQDRALNWAYAVDICEADDWPFLQASASGASPLTIADLRTVESVDDTTNDLKLEPSDRRYLTDTDPALSDTGNPWAYYVTAGSVINTYPADTVDIRVRYWKAPAELSADGDEPILPTRFHPLIVDAAVRRAYETGDEYEAAQVAQGIFEGRLEQMRATLLTQQHDRPEQHIITETSTDW